MCELMPDFLNLESKFVDKNCQLHLKIHWILTWYIVWPAGWLLYCGIWQDLLLLNDCECQHQSQFSPFKKIGVLYCFGISLVHSFIYHSMGKKFFERSSMRAYFYSPNILHSVMTRDLKYPDPLLSLGATHCLSRIFISKTLQVQKRLGMGMSSRCYPYP